MFAMTRMSPWRSPLVPCLAGVGCLLLAVTGHVAAKPAVFAPMTFDKARQLSVEQDRLLVVDFTADWCAPCQEMERTTWVDPEVVAWLGEHAITIQVDGDRDIQVTQRLGVFAYPTLIAFREGREFDRIQGYAGPDRLLKWLEPVSRGVSPIDAARQLADTSNNPEDQFDLIQMLFNSDQVAEAADRALAMWAALDNYRGTFSRQPNAQVFQILTELAMNHAPTRERIRARSAQLKPAVDDRTADLRQVHEWLLLCAATNDTQAVVAWHDRVAAVARAASDAPAEDVSDAAALLDASGPLLEPLLVHAQRYADIGRLYRDPAARAREIADDADAAVVDPMLADDEQRQKAAQGFFLGLAANVYSGLLAADRDEEAASVADVMVDHFGSDAALPLVGQALAIDEPRPTQRTLLSEAESMAKEALRQRLDVALQRQNPEDVAAP